MNDALVRYKFAKSWPLGKVDPGCLYEYVVGANGIFIQAEREGLSVMMPMLTFRKTRLAGLDDVTSKIWLPKLVPAEALLEVITDAWRVLPYEYLSYCHFSKEENQWRFIAPNQMSTRGSVHPDDKFDQISQNALLEIHSHGTMPAFFSETDDREENGFRIYAVIGNLDRRPVSISVRVSVYGHRALIPYQYIFETNPEVIDVSRH
jgi:PRTRC genetic system protein A